jgi:thiamine-monophosphate kinase
MDLSDGLAASLYQLSELNTIGFAINRNALPLVSRLESRPDALETALYTGGDFELLFTLPADAGKEIEAHLDIRRIGTVTDTTEVCLVDNHATQPIENKGYEHFKTPLKTRGTRY